MGAGLVASALLALSFGALTRCVTASCNHKRLQYCTAMLQTAIGNNQLLFVTDESQLDDICTTMNRGLMCIEEYISPCFTPVQKDIYNKLSGDAYDVINDLCSPGPIRQDYLRYATECFSKGSHEFKLCGYIFHVLTEDTAAQETPEQAEMYKVDICCAYSEYMHCVIVKVDEMCGDKVKVFVQDLIYRSSNRFTESHCRNLTFGSYGCSVGFRPRVDHLVGILVIVAILAEEYSKA